jgi:hypothetical protein
MYIIPKEEIFILQATTTENFHEKVTKFEKGKNGIELDDISLKNNILNLKVSDKPYFG